MKYTAALALALMLMTHTAMAVQQCEVPDSLIASDYDLSHVATQVKTQHRLDISVLGTGSSTLPGPDGALSAYPARLEKALNTLLPGTKVKVTVHIRSRQTAAQMAAALQQILADDKPALVIWQTGTFDALRGVETDEFSVSLNTGVSTIAAAGADIDLMNMQYNPRIASMLNVSAYSDVMRWVAQAHGILLFDRFEIMRYWNDQGVFDLYAATKRYDMARRVHDCVGQALASQIIGAAHLKP